MTDLNINDTELKLLLKKIQNSKQGFDCQNSRF